MTDAKEAARTALSQALRDPRVGFAIKACMIGGAYDAFTAAIEAATAPVDNPRITKKGQLPRSLRRDRYAAASE